MFYLQRVERKLDILLLMQLTQVEIDQLMAAPSCELPALIAELKDCQVIDGAAATQIIAQLTRIADSLEPPDKPPDGNRVAGIIVKPGESTPH